MTSIAISATPVAPRLRLTARGRAVLVALAAAPILVTVLLAGWNPSGAVAGSEAGTGDFSYVEVAPGQSLWQLAESLAPTADPRDVISDVMRLNSLDSATVVAGQRLAIPPRYLP